MSFYNFVDLEKAEFKATFKGQKTISEKRVSMRS